MVAVRVNLDIILSRFPCTALSLSNLPLRFIRRVQVVDGAVEVELYTSTNRDICELFKKADTTRILGCPTLLELILYPEYAKKRELQRSIHIFQRHVTESRKG
ncbi:hypothetical protein N431DRAFT_435610 [Stipitochalara longipes BDJ]|nr:hypothetical protein N431DRAFT_435610 [Stipitochalara longipes BDJ]